MKPRILLIEDDISIASNLSAFLGEEGMAVTVAGGRKIALSLLEKDTFDLVLLDITLPDGNGFSLCTLLKERQLPVIFLTASDDEYSIVTGLDMGADDYVTKPFRPRELLSRIRSVLRRYQHEPAELSLGPVSVDPERAKVMRNGQEIFLSALEYRLLLTLIQHKGKVVGRSALLEGIWDMAGRFVDDNTLTVYVKRLREKIEDDPQQPQLIQTVRGLGYRVASDEEVKS